MNEQNAYNLIDEPWIPVLMQDGRNKMVSLGEVFADEDGQIADLALNPYERVAVFRLLLCIAQAALGPERLKDEAAWLASRSAIGPVVTDYLKKWHDRFYLYGPHAFLQPDDVTTVKIDGTTSCDKLIFKLASGNNSTLFDHAAVSTSRKHTHSQLVIGLLTYQNFSAAGLSGKCLWSGSETDKSVKAAPCREQSMLFTILNGATVIESIWLNLLTRCMVERVLSAEWGCPAWELPNLSRSALCNFEMTFLGHLVPLSRTIKLFGDNASCVLGGGVVYPQLPTWREPMATVKPKADNTLAYVSADPSRMPWRELASILCIRGADGKRSALALRHVESLQEEHVFSIWAGGLCWEPGQAKQIDTVEWAASLSIAMLEETALHRYENAIGLAERQRGALRSATKLYASGMKIEDASRFYIPAEHIYWDILANPSNQKLVQSVDSPTYLDDWKKKATRKAAKEAYRRACPAVTARQMEAYVQGFSKLHVKEDSNERNN